MKRLLITAALAAAVAGPARAHEVECQKSVGLLAHDGYGHVVLDDRGSPTFSGAPAPILTLDAYPAIVGWRLEVDNLASVPSIVTGVEDRFFAACTGARVYGDVHAPPLTVPPSGMLGGVVAVRIGSYEECLALGGERDDDDGHEGGVCREVVDNTLVLTTESNVAQCRARLVCRPPKHGHGHGHGDDGHGHDGDGHGPGDDGHGHDDDGHGHDGHGHGDGGHGDDGDACWAPGHSRRWGT